MTDISFIPSDNLYKFLTFSGLAIVVMSIFAFASLISSGSKDIDSFNKEIIEWGVNHPKPISFDQTTDSEISNINKMFETRANNLKSVINIQTEWLAYIAGVGLMLMLIGFVLWYSMLQKHEDERLRLEIEKLKKEAEPIEHSTSKDKNSKKK